MNPKVSVCIPTYNYSRYLPETIESVLNQSYGDYELLVVDDCSTDNSRQVIDKYANKDKRIIIHVNPNNIGMVKNWNLCLKFARGEYIKFLFGDDTLSSDKTLGKMVFELDRNEETALISTARNIIDEKSRILNIASKYKNSRGITGTDIIRDCLVEQKNKIGEPSSVMFRKKHAARGFNESYQQIVDLEMWFHILEQGKFTYIDEPLVSFRTHPFQQTTINLKRTDLCRESFQLLQDYAKKPYLDLSAIERKYMFYVPVYSIWKQYKQKKISKLTALAEIKNHTSIREFYFYLPFYRFHKFWKRLSRKIHPKM